MRLPFGLGRRSSSGSGAGSGGSSTGSGSTVASAPAGGAAARPSRAWASLPPIQRTTGEMPLVASPGSFVDGLPGSTGLPPIVQPLGHEVSPLATPGLVVAHARPVAAPTSGRLPAPVQRRASRGARAEAVQPVAATSTIDDADSGWSPAAAEAPARAADAAPIRSLPTVSRMTIRMPDRPLTSAEIAARPASVQRAASGARATTPIPAPGGMRRSPSPITRATPTVSRQQAATVTPPTAAPLPTRPSPSSRSGLGAPLDELPSSARPIPAAPAAAPVVLPVSRSIAAPMPLVTSGHRTSVQRAAAGERATIDPGASAPPATAADPLRATGLQLPELPVLSVSRSTSASPAASPAVRPAPRASSPEVRPTLGARPLEPTVRVQRSTSATDPDDDDGEDDGDALPSPWWAPATASNGPSGFDGASGMDANPVVVSRSVSGQALGLGSNADYRGGADARRAAASRTIGRAVQRATTPVTALPGVRPAVTASLASAARRTSTAAAAETALAPVAQRQLVASPANVVVQTTPAPASAARSSGLPSHAPPVVQRAEADVATPARPPSTTQRSETDLEELAQALFSRIRGRLRSELIHDREAKGLSFDNI